MARTAQIDPAGPTTEPAKRFAPSPDEMQVGVGLDEAQDFAVGPIALSPEIPKHDAMVETMQNQLRDGSVAGGRVGRHDYAYGLQAGRFGYSPMVCIDNSEPKRLGPPMKTDEDALAVCAAHFQEAHKKAANEPKPKRMDEIANEAKVPSGRDTPRIDGIESHLNRIDHALSQVILDLKEIPNQEGADADRLKELESKISKMIRWADRQHSAMERLQADVADCEALVNKFWPKVEQFDRALALIAKTTVDEGKNIKRRLTVLETNAKIGPSARKGVPRKKKTPKKKKEGQHERNDTIDSRGQDKSVDEATGAGTAEADQNDQPRGDAGERSEA